MRFVAGALVIAALAVGGCSQVLDESAADVDATVKALAEIAIAATVAALPSTTSALSPTPTSQVAPSPTPTDAAQPTQSPSPRRMPTPTPLPFETPKPTPTPTPVLGPVTIDLARDSLDNEIDSSIMSPGDNNRTDFKKVRVGEPVTFKIFASPFSEGLRYRILVSTGARIFEIVVSWNVNRSLTWEPKESNISVLTRVYIEVKDGDGSLRIGSADDRVLFNYEVLAKSENINEEPAPTRTPKPPPTPTTTPRPAGSATPMVTPLPVGTAEPTVTPLRDGTAEPTVTPVPFRTVAPTPTPEFFGYPRIERVDDNLARFTTYSSRLRTGEYYSPSQQVRSGEVLVFTVTASHPAGRPLQYRLRFNFPGGSVQTGVDWTDNNVLEWTARTGLVAGTTTVRIDIKDEDEFFGYTLGVDDRTVLLYEVVRP